MICCSIIVRFSCAKVFALLTHGCGTLALFVCLMMCGCKAKSTATSAVMASATIGSMESEMLDTSCQVIQWDVFLTDSVGGTAPWRPMVRKTIATRRHALTNTHADAIKKDTATIVESSVPHGAIASATVKDIMQMSPLQLLLYRIGLIVCIFGLFFGFSYAVLAYFKKNA